MSNIANTQTHTPTHSTSRVSTTVLLTTQVGEQLSVKVEPRTVEVELSSVEAGVSYILNIMGSAL